MANFQIITDSCCDLSQQMYRELGLTAVPLNVHFSGLTSDDINDDRLRELYANLRKGSVITTSAVNPDRWAGAMEAVLSQGQDALVLCFSSGLSTTHQSAVIAAEEIAPKYPERTVRVVDTLSASMGEGLLVWYACQKREEGFSLEQTAAWCEENKPHLCHWFTVDDLMYLKRGGRVSAATAVMGTMLGIKPVLHMDNEGRLINVAKVRGRKASIDALAKKAKALGEGFGNKTVFISHGDCLDDAQYLAQILKRDCGVENVIINYVGAVIGSHSGPGTLALFFLGKER